MHDKKCIWYFYEKKKRMALSTRLRTAGDTRSSNSSVRSKAQDKVPRLEIKNPTKRFVPCNWLTSQSIGWLVNGGMLCILWGWSASLLTLLQPPPHSHRLHILLCKYISGNSTIGHSRPRGEVQLLFFSIPVCTRLVEAQLPSNRRKATVVPRGVSSIPVYGPLYRYIYHPGVRFSSANKVQECMGLTFVLYWNFLPPTYPFSATPSCCYCSCLVILGLTPNMRKNVTKYVTSRNRS